MMNLLIRYEWYKRWRWYWRNDFGKNPLSRISKWRYAFSFWALRKLIYIIPPSHRSQYLDFYETYRDVHLKSWEDSIEVMRAARKRYEEEAQRVKKEVYGL